MRLGWRSRKRRWCSCCAGRRTAALAFRGPLQHRSLRALASCLPHGRSEVPWRRWSSRERTRHGSTKALPEEIPLGAIVISLFRQKPDFLRLGVNLLLHRHLVLLSVPKPSGRIAVRLPFLSLTTRPGLEINNDGNHALEGRRRHVRRRPWEGWIFSISLDTHLTWSPTEGVYSGRKKERWRF